MATASRLLRDPCGWPAGCSAVAEYEVYGERAHRVGLFCGEHSVLVTRQTQLAEEEARLARNMARLEQAEATFVAQSAKVAEIRRRITELLQLLAGTEAGS